MAKTTAYPTARGGRPRRFPRTRARRALRRPARPRSSRGAAELALASRFVLTASKKERERLARDRAARAWGSRAGRQAARRAALGRAEPWRLGLTRAPARLLLKEGRRRKGQRRGGRGGREEPDSTKPSGSGSQAPVAPPSAPTLGGLRPLSSAAIRRAARRRRRRRRARARSRRARRAHVRAQTKAFDLVKTLAAAAPEARAPPAAFAAEAEARAADAAAAGRRRRAAAPNARTPRKPPRWKRGRRGGNPRRPERLLPFRTPER